MDLLLSLMKTRSPFVFSRYFFGFVSVWKDLFSVGNHQ